MYEMATGQMAFSGSSNGVIFEAILNRAPEPVENLNPAIPQKLDDLITKSLEKERDMRYQTAAELRGDLKRIKRGLESSRIRAASASGIAAFRRRRVRLHLRFREAWFRAGECGLRLRLPAHWLYWRDWRWALLLLKGSSKPGFC